MNRPPFNKRELRRLWAALNDAISDRESFVSCHYIHDKPMKGYAAIIARSNGSIRAYRKLQEKIGKLIDGMAAARLTATGKGRGRKR